MRDCRGGRWVGGGQGCVWGGVGGGGAGAATERESGGWTWRRAGVGSGGGEGWWMGLRHAPSRFPELALSVTGCALRVSEKTDVKDPR